MTYATQQELIDRYGEQALVMLTDRAPIATGAIDSDVVAKALSDADELIDGYLSTRYALPLASVPPLVAQLARVIAYWMLHLTEPDTKTTKAYDNALRRLRDIASGAMRIPAAGLEPATTNAGGVQMTSRERPFTEATMKGLI